MPDPPKNNLTPEETKGIILTDNEARIILNMRRLSRSYPNGQYAVLYTNHHGEVQYGTACHKDITERI